MGSPGSSHLFGSISHENDTLFFKKSREIIYPTMQKTLSRNGLWMIPNPNSGEGLTGGGLGRGGEGKGKEEIEIGRESSSFDFGIGIGIGNESTGTINIYKDELLNKTKLDHSDKENEMNIHMSRTLSNVDLAVFQVLEPFRHSSTIQFECTPITDIRGAGDWVAACGGNNIGLWKWS